MFNKNNSEILEINVKSPRKNKRSLFASAALTLTLALGAGQAMASACFIMVHGHGTQGNVHSGSNQPALDYWQTANFSEYNGSSFFDDLLASGDNYGVVGYNSTESGGYPYWRNETAGEIARQIIAIKSGSGDGYNHPQANTQCSSSDSFWVISHSQGGAEMMWIAGNAVSGSPYYNTAFTASGSTSVSYSSAMSGVLGIFTLGGAITGTEAADRACNGSFLDSIIVTLLGRNCYGDTEWLQTNTSYTVKSYIGSNLGAPVYTAGGYRGFPGIAGASSALLAGEDDGFINLASQMSCSGSGKRSIESDLNSYKSFFGINYGSPTFRCNNANKGTPRTYNLASVYTDHDAEHNAGIANPSSTSIENGITCGSRTNMAGRINDCVN